MAAELVVKGGADDLVDKWLGPGAEDEQRDALFDDTAPRDSRGRPIKPAPELTAVQKKLKRKIEEGRAAKIAARKAVEESDEEREESRAGAIKKTAAPAVREQAGFGDEKRKKEAKQKPAATATSSAKEKEAKEKEAPAVDSSPQADAIITAANTAPPAPVAKQLSRSVWLS